MLAYAANRRRELEDRRPHPNTMLLIISAHVAALAFLMSAKMDLPAKIKPVITEIRMIPIDDPSPPVRHPVRSPQPVPADPVTHPQARMPIQSSDPVRFDPGPIVDPGAGLDAGRANVTPEIRDPVPTPVRTGPRLLTSPSEAKPPYPAMKLLNEEEGAVTVRLTIDAQGRVIAVDPVGKADPAFLEAARRHLLARWRFRPASEDGRAVVSSTVVTLRFELHG